MQVESAIIYLIVIIYFAVLIWLGIWSRRRLVSPEDYHIAGRKVGAFINGSAYIAGYLSIASFLGIPGYYFIIGSTFAWACLGVLTAIPFGAALVAAQLRKAMPVSTTDYFAWRFETDRYGRALLSIAYAWGAVLYIALCLVGMGQALFAILRVHYIVALIITAIVVLFYLWFGGMIATTFTAAFQAWVMTFAAVAIVIGMFVAAGGPAQLYETAKSITPNAFISAPHNPVYYKTLVKGFFDPAYVFAGGFLSIILWYICWNWGGISMPYAIVRIFTAFDKKTARWSMFWAALIGFIFYTLMALIGIGERALIEGFSPHPLIEIGKKIMPANPTLGILAYYAKTYGIGSPVDYACIAVAEALRNPWILGLACTGALAIAMSTIATWCSLMGTVIARDWPRFILGRGALPPNKEILVARITMVVFVIISMILAISPPAMVADLSGAAFLVITAICAPPLFMGIWWKRGGPTTFKIYATIMLIATISSWLFSYFVWGSHHLCAFFPALLTPHQVYWYFIGFVLWIILCLVTKPAKPETIKKYCEDLHTP
jgi:SSS family solute:Na+ symporter